MPESVGPWWARRQWSKAVAVPYPIGRYRDAWRPYPALVRQYHPELNHGIVLSQIPPAAEVYLVWECELGHRFVATPQEQRSRPGGPQRRRSSWCPECARLARPRMPPGAPASSDGPAPARPASGSAAFGRRRASVGAAPAPPGCALCRRAPPLAPGTAYASPHAPRVSSAVEAGLHRALIERYCFDPAPSAVRVAAPFFGHLEVWPDVVIAELRVAVEYDTIGRHGLEHTGRNEHRDRRKDRALRAADWEVVRLRTRPLQPIGPFDVACSGLTAVALDALDTALGRIRGELFVAAYRR
ncbi:MAG: hypothetical protein QM635_04380 [Microbacteriaceae bacterium]